MTFTENRTYGCVDCGSTNHTTGDLRWCRVAQQAAVLANDDKVCFLCGAPTVRVEKFSGPINMPTCTCLEDLTEAWIEKRWPRNG